jgi:hypothetical protein
MCQTDGDIPTIDKCNVIVASIKIFNQIGGKNDASCSRFPSRRIKSTPIEMPLFRKFRTVASFLPP